MNHAAMLTISTARRRAPRRAPGLASGLALGITLTLALGGCDGDAGPGTGPDTGPDTGDVDLLDHDGALSCTDLESITGPTTLAEECRPADVAGVTVTAESDPIRASVDRIYEALTDPEQFGAFPRPLPPDFEPPPVPHSVVLPTAGEPFLAHYRLFYGALQTSTVRETHEADRIEVVQLWRVNPTWTEEELTAMYPDLPPDEVAALTGTPIMPDGLRTIVTFTIQAVDNPLDDYAYVSMVQRGLPATSYPLVKLHWRQLYFDPMKQYLEAP